MKAKIRKSRQRKRTFKKFVKRLFLLCLLTIGVGWAILHYEDIVHLTDRFTVTDVEDRDIDGMYDMLLEKKDVGENLIFDLGLKESDDLRVAMERLQKIMGLDRYTIKLDTHNKKTPPGYISATGDDMTIYLAKEITERNEKITILIHELGHIYVWNLPKRNFMGFDQEKLVDTSGIFLGLGLLYLNGMKDEFNVLPDGSYTTEQKTFGYLKPEQFGYLLARFCKSKGLTPETLKPYLNNAGWKYFKLGNAYLQRETEGITTPEIIQKAQIEIRKLLKKINIDAEEVVVIR